ncbi:MAG: nitroreductase [Firmicutes bacterium]|nr:nitroreductase [Bacillota bacterium]
MDYYAVVNSRCSIRKYRSDQIEQEKVIRVLDAARRAPSWKNQQCWRFLVVADAAKRQALSETLRQGNPATKAFLQAPLVVALCAKPDDSGNVNGREYYMLDAGLALENLTLAATNEGLATCIVGAFNEDLVRTALGVPPDFRVVALTPLGYPEEQPNPRPRKSLEEIAFWEQWGQPIA